LHCWHQVFQHGRPSVTTGRAPRGGWPVRFDLLELDGPHRRRCCFLIEPRRRAPTRSAELRRAHWPGRVHRQPVRPLVRVRRLAPGLAHAVPVASRRWPSSGFRGRPPQTRGDGPLVMQVCHIHTLNCNIDHKKYYSVSIFK
jgi:hypothetical protein